MESYVCDNCGETLNKEQKFCPKCGTAQKIVQENEQGAQIEKSPQSCPKCGRQLAANDMFCPGCGNPINSSQSADFVQQMRNTYKSADQSNTYNNNNNRPSSYINPASSDVDAYIQVKVDYYKRKFEKFWLSDSKTSWNWAAFFFAPYWFIYRKMYKWGFGILAAQLILTIIDGWVTSLLLFGMAITFGILGNYIYKERIDKLVIEGNNIGEPGKAQHIQKNGGINKKAMVLTLVGYIILYSILSASGAINDDIYYDDSYSSTATTTYCSTSGCTNYAEYGNYCIDHVCLADGCTNQREPGSEYCNLHQ